MFQILLDEIFYSITMFVFFIISISILLFLAWKYKGLIKEAENMSITKRKELKVIKTKFINSYGEGEKGGQINIEVFVDKSVCKLRFSGLREHTWKFFSTQSIIFSVACAGIAICKNIIYGKTIREISALYIVAFIELYLYFSIISIIDFESKKQILRLNIIEYIENHLIQRVKTASAFEIEENLINLLEEEQKNKDVFSEEMEKELDCLLQEYLV